MEHDVFICHSTADARTAAEICDLLEANEVRCWIAPRDPVAGIPYSQQIVAAIEAAPVLLLVFSGNANNTRAVLSELELAANRGKVILPVRIDDVPPASALEFYVRAIHWFDAATQPLHEVGRELVRQVKTLAGRPSAMVTERTQTVEAPHHNLPFSLTSFVGREREIGELEDLLQTARLVTLCGAGGIGKTSLAVHVATRKLDAYPDGVWFVDLAQAEDESLLVATFAAVFGLEESPRRPIAETLLAYLRKKHLLLIADNCEHVVAEAARLVERILRSSLRVAVLATSREALGVAGERTYRVPSLACPRSAMVRTLNADTALEFGALALFADRAQAAKPNFVLDDDNAPTVAAICGRLDGIALAIELAAARVSVMSLHELSESLNERFRVLTSGARTALPRQKTLRALIDWSYDLLSQNEQQLFRRLAVFAGDFTLNDTVAVCADGAIRNFEILDLLASLIDKSLVQADFTSDDTRYRLLESMRAYGSEKLAERGEFDALHRAHALAFLKTAERLEDHWETTPDAAWKERAEPNFENWRAALRWALDADGDRAVGQQLAATLRPVWFSLARSEGRRWIKAGTDAISEVTPPEVVAKLALCEAHLAMLAQQYEAALTPADRAREIFQQIGDSEGAALAGMFVGAARGLQGDVGAGAPLLEEALKEFRRRGSQRTISSTLIYLGTVKIIAGDTSGSRPLFHEALSLLKSIGATRPAAHIAPLLAEAEFQDGNAVTAVDLLSEAVAAERALGHLDNVPFDLCNLSAYLIALDRWNDAERDAREALALALDRQIPAATVWALHHLSAILALRGYEDDRAELAARRRAAQLLGFVDARIAELRMRRDFTEQKEYERALRALSSALRGEADALRDEGRRWNQERAAEEAVR